jgi:hypothetical protein
MAVQHGSFSPRHLATYATPLRDAPNLLQRSRCLPMKRLADSLQAAMRWCLDHPLGRSQWIALGAWLVLLSTGMLAMGGYIVLKTNRDPERADQSAYLMLAEKTRGVPWPTATDGIRNPLFPWMLAKVAAGDRDTMFAAGLRLNLRLGALVAILLGAWAGTRMAWLPAVLFVTLGGLGVLMPISTYVGTEIVFYGLLFAAWMLAFGLLEKLTFSRCAIFGATLALAYLAKPGITLLSGALLAVAVVRWLTSDDASGWRGWRPLAGGAIALGISMAMMLPRMIDASRRFGDPLQNTAANCFWEDSWEACVPKLAHLNPRLAHKLPPGEWPSAKRYFERNGASGAWTRLTTGIASQVENIINPGPKSILFSRRPSPDHPVRRVFPYRGLFLLPPLLLAGVAAVLCARVHGAGAFPRGTAYQLAFATLLIGGSLGAFGWYHVIASGSRFIMALYLPVLASLLIAADALRRRFATRWLDAVSAVAWVLMLGVLLAHMGILATHPYFDKMRGAF